MSGLVKGSPGSPEGTDEYYLDNRVEVNTEQHFEIVKCNALIFRALEPSCSGRPWEFSTSSTLPFEPQSSRFSPTSVPPALCSILESAHNKRLPFSCLFSTSTTRRSLWTLFSEINSVPFQPPAPILLYLRICRRMFFLVKSFVSLSDLCFAFFMICSPFM